MPEGTLCGQKAQSNSWEWKLCYNELTYKWDSEAKLSAEPVSGNETPRGAEERHGQIRQTGYHACEDGWESEFGGDVGGEDGGQVEEGEVDETVTHQGAEDLGVAHNSGDHLKQHEFAFRCRLTMNNCSNLRSELIFLRIAFCFAWFFCWVHMLWTSGCPVKNVFFFWILVT